MAEGQRSKQLIYTLDMVVEIVDGQYVIDAPWLKEPVCGETFEEAYELALRTRRGASTSA